MRIILLVTLLNYSIVFADQGLDQLKQSFSGMISSATKEFDKAAKMKPIIVKKGTEISYDDCEQIKVKIRENYKIDPFEITYESGTTYSYMCGSDYGSGKNFIQTISAKSNLDLQYAMVVSLEFKHSNRSSFKNYFIDSHYRIVEMQNLSYYLNTNELLEYYIDSIDQNGNVYSSTFTKNYRISYTDIEGTQTIEKFIPADGTSPEPLIRNTVKHVLDKAKDYQVLKFTRSDKKDWNEFLLQITHAWMGGFYNYSGKLYRENRHNSALVIKSRGGKEYCSYGDVNREQDWLQYPADNVVYYRCFNY